MSVPSRRRFMKTAAIGGAALAAGGAIAYALKTPLPQLIREQRESLHASAVDRVKNHRLPRADGYTYTVDVGQLMLYSALAADQASYSTLRDYVLKSLIHNDAKDPFTQGFIVWRHKPGDELDATGTTEMLRCAHALWIGAKTFNQPADAETAVMILQGYARHANTSFGVWLIRNYYKFDTRGFATNSFLVDYDPDFLAEVAAATKDKLIAETAAKSLELFRKCVTPAGLLYDLIQPDLKTMYPQLESIVYFSPNDIIQYSNSATTACTVVKSSPDIAKRVLKFGLDRCDDLHGYYLGRSGQAADNDRAGITAFSILTRLAALLKDEPAARKMADIAVTHWRWAARSPEKLEAYLLSEILMTLHHLIPLIPAE